MPNAVNRKLTSPIHGLHDGLMDVDRLEVVVHGDVVGTLASTPEGDMAFQYSDEWLVSGFSISPFSLPLEKRVFVADPKSPEGLFGVFGDSLPDGWGRLLVDRFLRKQGFDPMELPTLARLAIVGASGMGALEYRPAIDVPKPVDGRSFDELATECAMLLEQKQVEDLDVLFAMGGSSGGARPKVLTVIDGEDWIVKFPSSIDGLDIGAKEFATALVAAKAGIEMPEVRLLPSKRCPGYFAAKRFDRIRTSGSGSLTKIHMASAAGLLETSHRFPNLDYSDLMKLALMLSDDMEQVEAMFRLMAFNVFVGNRDDHSKNFSFLREEAPEGGWRVSPGYDLTSNPGMNGEHFTTVNGKGKNITVADLEEVGIRAGLRAAVARSAVEDVSDAVKSELEDVVDLPNIRMR